MTLTLIELGLGVLNSLMSTFTKSGVPTEVTNSIQSAINAVQAHYDDLVTKANLEAQRG
jgi:hypothetical protein